MNQAVFKCVCREKVNKEVVSIEREVREVDFTIEWFKKMWEKQYPKYKTLMGKEIHTFEEFISFFVRQNFATDKLESKGILFSIDDVGIFWVSDLNWPAYAEVHYTFWDGRLNGRLDLCRKGVKYVFEHYGFKCLYVRVAAYADKHWRFVESMGFVKEGILRSRVKYKETWWDLKCYSLLKHEIANWRLPE